jgi:hypothetical protein
MPFQKIKIQPVDGVVPEDSDPTREEVNEMLDSFDTDKLMKRIDVLEDMLDIMNER